MSALVHREKQDKAFKSLAAKGKGAIGRLYGFSCIWRQQAAVKPPVLFLLLAMWMAATKLPLPSWQRACLASSLVAGVISQKSLWRSFLAKGLGFRPNSKKHEKTTGKNEGAILLGKCALIESVNGFLKNTCQIEHTRHRSPY